jgi:hypothetical protein
MPSKRVRYKGELLHHNGVPWPQAADPPPRIVAAIERATRSLKPFQREVIIRRFWQGQDFRAIAMALDSSPDDIRNCLRQTLRRLRSAFASNSDVNQGRPRCKICRHPKRTEIDRLLGLRRRHDTWRGYVSALRIQFGITGVPPKAVEAHLRNHRGGKVRGDT